MIIKFGTLDAVIKAAPRAETSTFILMTQNGIMSRFLKLWFYAQPQGARSEDNKITGGLLYTSISRERNALRLRINIEYFCIMVFFLIQKLRQNSHILYT